MVWFRWTANEPVKGREVPQDAQSLNKNLCSLFEAGVPHSHLLDASFNLNMQHSKAK